MSICLTFSPAAAVAVTMKTRGGATIGTRHVTRHHPQRPLSVKHKHHLVVNINIHVVKLHPRRMKKFSGETSWQLSQGATV